MIWLVFALLALAVIALLAWPLLRGRADVEARTGYDLAVYKDQLREVDADVERGLLTAPQAEAARTEIKRRMLAAADASERARKGGLSPRVIAAVLAVAVPVGAVLLYNHLGAPTLRDQPFAARDVGPQGVPHEQMQQITGMVDSLAKRLEQDPANAEGWVMLARSARALERWTQALDAYRRAIALGVKDPELFAGYGETLMYASQGEVTPEAVNAFEEALRLDATEPRSRFFLGAAHLQQGDAAGAIAIWRDLEKDAPPDAGWVQGVREQIQRAAAQSGIDPATIAPKGPQVAGGTQPKPAGPSPEQQAMIQQMVDGLAAKLKDNPGDADGWQRLGRAYRVQLKFDQAKEAYGKAMALEPRNVQHKLGYADVLLAQAPEDGPDMPAEFVGVMREILMVDGKNADALYYLGLAEAQAGRKSEAKELWTRLLGQLPANSPERQSLQQQIEQL